MPATIVSRSDTAFTIQVEIPYGPSMLEAQETIQEHLDRAGTLATGEMLQRFDTDGSPIVVGDTQLTSMGRVLKEYQTPYGVAPVERHIYQSSRGGKTYCPPDRNARIVGRCTPRFAKMVSHQYAEFGSSRVIEDLRENHGRTVARSFVQDVADAVAAVAMIRQEDWDYTLPKVEEPISTIAVGMDGTCLLMCEDGWRETMVGTIGLYDPDGERQHTIYLAATPEYGQATSLDRLEREIGRVKAAFPQARYVGLADGAKGNWEFLSRHTDIQVIDFWHAAESLSDAADALFARERGAKRPWLESSCHRLKHEPRAARQLVRDLRRLAAEKGVAADQPEVEAAITYFTHQSRAGRMDDAPLVESYIPIGSGVTEAACQVLVKQRLCGSGMKWKEPGAAAVLSVRCLTYTTGRWSQFWGRIDQYGFPVAA